jgi:hypothetical protein
MQVPDDGDHVARRDRIAESPASPQHPADRGCDLAVSHDARGGGRRRIAGEQPEVMEQAVDDGPVLLVRRVLLGAETSDLGLHRRHPTAHCTRNQQARMPSADTTPLQAEGARRAEAAPGDIAVPRRELHVRDDQPAGTPAVHRQHEVGAQGIVVQ